jgi:hypothetical protein
MVPTLFNKAWCLLMGVINIFSLTIPCVSHFPSRLMAPKATLSDQSPFVSEWKYRAHSTPSSVRCVCVPLGRGSLYHRSLSISKLYFSPKEPPGVSERMCSVILDVAISGEYQTLRGHASQSPEWLGSLMTYSGFQWQWLWWIWEHLGVPEGTFLAPGSTWVHRGPA